jgi:hypothetical protein
MPSMMRRRTPSIPTIADLKRQQRRVDRRRTSAAHVLTRMQRGESLLLCFENGHSVWRTSGGLKVAEDIARSVIAHTDVCGVGDALFGGLSQTWRWIEN